MKWLYIIIFLFLSLLSQAQKNSVYEVITYSGVPVNTWTMLPDNYTPAKKYPYIVYVGGSGEIGTGTFATDSTRTYRYGPLRYIKLGNWDQKIQFRQLDGSIIDTSVIAICIQPRSNTTARSILSRIVDSLAKRYPPDTMRMILTGLSMGGQMDNQVLMLNTNSTSPNITYAHFMRFSAALVFSTPYPTGGGSVSNLGFWLNMGRFYYYGVGGSDPNTTIEPSDLAGFKALYPDRVYAYTYPGEGHDSWNTRYNPSYLDPVLGLNIYDCAGLADKYPKAFAPSVINVNTTSTIIFGQVAGDNANYTFSVTSGPNSPGLTQNADTSVTLTGLVNGTYVINLRARNGLGSSASFVDYPITLNVNTSVKPDPKIITTRKRGQKVRVYKSP